MFTINDYLKFYKDKPLNEIGWNQIDNLLCSILVYIPIPNFKKDGYKVYGTKVNGGKSLKSVERCEKFVIIMGNEGTGVRPEVLDLCNEYLYINMNEKCESLNVGVATSIILYELDK